MPPISDDNKLTRDGGYIYGIPGVRLKKVPLAVERLRELLAQPENEDIAVAGKKGKTFEECIENICTFLDIAVDGQYNVPDLCNMLIIAINRRGNKGLAIHERAPGLLEVEMHEHDDRIDLLETGEIGRDKVINLSEMDGRPRYVICDNCKTSFDCISNRTCGLGKAARQQGEV